MNLKTFYLENLFSGYTEKMPKWLSKEAHQEILIIDLLIRSLNKSPIGMKALDIGCGDCRIYKQVTPLSYFSKRVACDIFARNELPSNFVSWLWKSGIKYQQIPQTNGMSYIPAEWGLFDVITCLGVDIHLDNIACDQLLENAKSHLAKDGIMIWQSNRKDTFKGWRLNWVDRKLDYQYRDNDFYTPYKEKHSTKVSHIYVYRP